MYAVEKTKEINFSKLQEGLEKQYGPAIAQDIIDHINKTGKVNKTPDYMDVKAMSELQERFRAQAMMAVWRLKDWRKRHSKFLGPENLVQLEGAFLQRQCEDAVRLYREATKSYFSMYREAMAMINATSLANKLANKSGNVAA